MSNFVSSCFRVFVIKKTNSYTSYKVVSVCANANNFIAGVTIGLFNYKDSETAANKVAHAGWNLKTTGSGGRAGRVSHECLVALTNSQDA